MSIARVEQILKQSPFVAMDPAAFPPRTPLQGILQNDCRWVDFEPGDLIMRQGEYGGSVFLVLSGELAATLEKLPDQLLGRSLPQRKSWLELLKQLINDPQANERRSLGENHKAVVRGNDRPRVFVQDIPGVFQGPTSQRLRHGEMFGEVSALTRSPRNATVIACTAGALLEIRWQGFRELLQYAVALREHVNESYRKNSLFGHLRETDIFQHLHDDQIHELVSNADLQSFGRMQWTSDYRSILKQDIAERILREPLIAQQGDYVDSLWIIRSGFGRVTRRHGVGEQTIEYLGKGRHFGLREIAHNHRAQTQRPWQLSLRAVGYVDAIRLPSDVIERLVIPGLPAQLLPPALAESKAKVSEPTQSPGHQPSRRLETRKSSLETSLLENLVEHRLINGTQAMVIDLNRCTRCDDCVRACATAHDNNPRFVRDGRTVENLMFAQACMHCQDPVCMIGCPTGAIARDEQSGVIAINDQTCIGCQTCANSCPYSNIKMVPISDRQGRPIIDQTSQLPVLQATKCDLCRDQPAGPACQRACPHDALIRIDLTSTDLLTQWLRG